MAPFGVYSDELGRTLAPPKRGRARLSKSRPPRRSKPLNNTPRPQLLAHRTSIILQRGGTLDGLAYSTDIVNRCLNVNMSSRQPSDSSGGQRDKPLPPVPIAAQGQASARVRRQISMPRMQSNPNFSHSPRQHDVFPHAMYARAANQTISSFGSFSPDASNLSNELFDNKDDDPVQPSKNPEPLKAKSANTTSTSGLVQKPSIMNLGLFRSKEKQKQKEKHQADPGSTSSHSAFAEKPPPQDKISSLNTASAPHSQTDIGSKAFKSLDDVFEGEVASLPVRRPDPTKNALPLKHTRAMLPESPSQFHLSALPQSTSQYGLKQAPAPQDLRRTAGANNFMGKVKGAFSSFTHSNKHAKHKRVTTMSQDALTEDFKQEPQKEKKVLLKRPDATHASTAKAATDKPRLSYFPSKPDITSAKAQEVNAERSSRPSLTFGIMEEDPDYPFVEPPAELWQKSKEADDHTPLLANYDHTKPWPAGYADKVGVNVNIAGRLHPAHHNPLRQHMNVMEFAKRPTDRVIEALGTVDPLKPPSTGVSVQSEPAPNKTVYGCPPTSARLTSYYSEPVHTSDDNPAASPSSSRDSPHPNRHTLAAAHKGCHHREQDANRVTDVRHSMSEPQSPMSTFGSAPIVSGGDPTLAFGRGSQLFPSSYGPTMQYSREGSHYDLGQDAEACARFMTSEDGVSTRSHSSHSLSEENELPQRIASLPGSGAQASRSAQSYPGSYEYRRQGIALHMSPLKRTVSTVSHYELEQESARLFNGKAYSSPPDYSDSDIDDGDRYANDVDTSAVTAHRLSTVPERQENRNSDSTISHRRSASAANLLGQQESNRSSSSSGNTLRRRRHTNLSTSMLPVEREELSSRLYGGEGSPSRRNSGDSDFSIASSLRDMVDSYGDDGVFLGEAVAVPIVFSGKAKLVDIPARKKK